MIPKIIMAEIEPILAKLSSVEVLAIRKAISDATRLAEMDSYSIGYEEGFEKGNRKGYASGLEEGKKVGYRYGFQDGEESASYRGVMVWTDTQQNLGETK